MNKRCRFTYLYRTTAWISYGGGKTGSGEYRRGDARNWEENACFQHVAVSGCEYRELNNKDDNRYLKYEKEMAIVIYKWNYYKAICVL